MLRERPDLPDLQDQVEDEPIIDPHPLQHPMRRLTDAKADPEDEDIFGSQLTVGHMIVRQLAKNERGLEQARLALEDKMEHDQQQDEELESIKAWRINLERKYARLMSYVHYILGALVLFGLEQVIVHFGPWFH